MRPSRNRALPVLLIVLPLLAASNAIQCVAASAIQPVSAISTEPKSDLFIGGCGGVYFLAEPGMLEVEVLKRDRNQRGRRTDLRAILAGPDRRVLQEATIPDDGQARGSGLGPVQRCRLSARVERKGVYALNITVSQDRYGEEVVWGLRSNCRKYLIETARGHKDEAHQEPIVLASPGQPADVCFLPRRKEFTLDVTGLPKDTPPLQMFDAGNRLLATISVDANGRAAHMFAADLPRSAAPWRLRVPSAQGTVNLDGVTRWNRSDFQPDLACWTPDPGSWFPLLENRWLLTPYSRTVYGKPGEPIEVALQVRNDSSRERTIQLTTEFSGNAWPVKLSTDRLKLGAKRSATITVRGTAPAIGKASECLVRTTPLDDSGFTTYSTLTLKAGEAPATKPITLPLVLKPYQHENEQLGYLPDYSVDNQVYFDRRNQPFVLTGGSVATLRDGHWSTTPLGANVQPRTPASAGNSFNALTTKIAFDKDNDVYVLASAGRTAALLHSTNGGRSFAAYVIPGREDRSRSYDLEQFSGHNVPDGPPPFVRFTHTASDDKHFWRRLHDLDLFVPKKVSGRIVMGEPVRISEQCIGLAAHSGTPSSIVSRGGRVHVAWGEATDPKVKVPGLPAFVVTYDRATGQLGKPALVGHGAPANDIHNTPSITMDSKGYLHVISGTHGSPFPYARSLQPNDAGGGWTQPEFVGDKLSQTYVGLVCGPDDTLHLAFRLWRTGEPHPASSFGTLAWQRKRPDQPWEAPRVLVVPPFSEYSVYYHRLTIDRAGRLFLSYDYWSTFWFYRNDRFGRQQTLLTSPDGGETWKLAEGKDLRP